MAWLTFTIDVDDTAKSFAYNASTQALGVKGNPKAKKMVLQASPANTVNVSIAGAPNGSSVTDGDGLVLVPGGQLTFDAGQLDARVGSGENWLLDVDWSTVYGIASVANQVVSISILT